MDDLEILRKDWKDNFNDFSNYSEKELFGMIKGKSVSINKTLLIIGTCEILFWLLLYFFDRQEGEPFFSIQSVVRCIIFLFFIMVLIVSFTKINNSSNSKTLMKRILDLRKTILWYVVITFFTVLIFGILNSEENAQSAIKGWVEGYNDAKLENHESVTEYGLPESAAYFLYVIMLFFLLILLYFIYKKLYGNILEKLKANYAELTKLEEIQSE